MSPLLTTKTLATKETKADAPAAAENTSPEISTAVTVSEMNSVILHTKKLLDAQPKRAARIRMDRTPDPKAPNFETVCVNGYVYQIKKGVEVMVPETVYELLADSGLI